MTRTRAHGGSSAPITRRTAPPAADQTASQPPAAPADEGVGSQVILLFIGLMIAMFMFSLNQTVLATALPTIVGELHGVEQMLWVATAFMLASTIMMPIYGAVGDQFGRKPLFIFAISAFLVGSVIGLFAQSMGMLIAGRVIQGIGGGGMMILSQAIIAGVVPARQRGKYMGFMGASFAVSSVAGPLIGGWLTDGPGWRWAFAINLPLGAIAILSALLFLRMPQETAGASKRIDVAGMALIAVFTTSLILVSAWGGHQYAWTSAVIIGLSAAAAVSGIAFVFVEARAAEPIMPLWLFRDRNFILSTLAGIALGVGMFGVLSYMPTYLQMVYGLDPTVAGLTMVPMMGVMLLSSIVVGQIVSKTGRYKIYPIVGILLAAASLAAMGVLTETSPLGLLTACLAGLGLGLGLSMQMLVLVVQNSFPVVHVGKATASNNFFRQIGGTLGMALVGTLFTTRLMEELRAGLSGLGAGAAQASGSFQDLTPAIVASLPAPIHDVITASYNHALIPLFLWVAPLPVIGAIILLFLEEKPLATRVERVSEEPAAAAATAVGADSGEPVEESGGAGERARTRLDLEDEEAAEAASGGSGR